MPYKIEPKFEVECSSKVSEQCKGKFVVTRRSYQTTLKNNNGKYICIYCSRATKSSGRNNPNSTHTLDDSALKIIDTEAKAYLLGWIASDGHLDNNITSIQIHDKDRYMLERLKTIIDSDVEIKSHEDNKVSITFSSKQLMLDACKHLSINPGKKDSMVQFPTLESKELGWAFLRGYFDGDGSIRKTEVRRQPECKITSNSVLMLTAIKDFCEIPCHVYNANISWSGNNALDFMAKLYDNADPQYRLLRKYERYLDWCSYIPALHGHYGSHSTFKWSKTDINAVAPSKAHASDSGYDLTAIKLIKTVGMISYYDTGIKLFPDYGWYFMVFPRSSTPKTGYTLANNVGIIDRTYTGSIILAMIKHDASKPDLELPAKIAQAVPVPIIHAQLVEVENSEELNNTSRNVGGFGSSDKKG